MQLRRGWIYVFVMRGGRVLEAHFVGSLGGKILFLRTLPFLECQDVPRTIHASDVIMATPVTEARTGMTGLDYHLALSEVFD